MLLEFDDALCGAHGMAMEMVWEMGFREGMQVILWVMAEDSYEF